MRTFHHYGVPVTTPVENEIHVENLKLFVTDPESHPFRIEFLRFEEGSCMPPEVQGKPHAAFMVDDLEAEVKGHKVIVEPMAVGDTLKIAFIDDNGAVIELMQTV